MATIKSTTATGVGVEIRTNGLEYCGRPVAELLIYFDHPTHGRCLVISRSYDDSRGVAGAVGPCDAGISGEIFTPTFKAAKRLGTVKIGISREVFDAALAQARAEADAAVAAVAAEEEAAGDAAKAACPAGFVPCRQKWSNGDLMSACYVSGDGVEVIASDLLDGHGGWYYLPSEDVEAARAKVAAAAGREKAAREAEEAVVSAAAREATETGRPVEVARWTEDCDGSADECSTDLCVRYATPDGSFKVTRTHTH